MPHHYVNKCLHCTDKSYNLAGLWHKWVQTILIAIWIFPLWKKIRFQHHFQEKAIAHITLVISWRDKLHNCSSNRFKVYWVCLVIWFIPQISLLFHILNLCLAWWSLIKQPCILSYSIHFIYVISVVKDGQYSLVFASPEMINESPWWDYFEDLEERVCLMALDEVHCLTKWYESQKSTKNICHLLPCSQSVVLFAKPQGKNFSARLSQCAKASGAFFKSTNYVFDSNC